MSDEIAAIRARWAGARWHYEVGRDDADDYAYSACLSVGGDGDGTILLDEPSAAAQRTLQLAVQAIRDIQALLDALRRMTERLVAAEALMQALLACGEITPTPELGRLMDAYNAVVRGAP